MDSQKSANFLDIAERMKGLKRKLRKNCQIVMTLISIRTNVLYRKIIIYI